MPVASDQWPTAMVMQLLLMLSDKHVEAIIGAIDLTKPFDTLTWPSRIE